MFDKNFIYENIKTLFYALIISISLRFRLSRNPVPKAFAKDSFAANLLEKKLVLLR